jgi:hypothetical protein
MFTPACNYTALCICVWMCSCDLAPPPLFASRVPQDVRPGAGAALYLFIPGVLCLRLYMCLRAHDQRSCRVVINI